MEYCANEHGKRGFDLTLRYPLSADEFPPMLDKPMLIAEFEVMVSYGQVVVFDSEIAFPQLDWTDDHVAQGFLWHSGAVSFGVPDHDGQSLIQLEYKDNLEPNQEALWAIRVPFDVPPRSLSVGSLFERQNVRVPAGKHSLVFEAFPYSSISDTDIAFVLSMKFVPDKNSEFQIIKQGVELTTDTVLQTGE